ncbi:AraC family transcriptional regulator [Occultella aeris]|uniref:HTH-type transcriptional regulator RipA n=1 Tax=Occultella aeris TaxID=2761496 RepID=A0A7M4DQC2_9MICO|nr:AraC family transcriptional regulator [Occultella aeris]VZO39666.1 HTH-type transcriptional repressor of iron proteins A [Occultella aeris]
MPVDVPESPVLPGGIPEPYLLTTAVVDGTGAGGATPHRHPEDMLVWPHRGAVSVRVQEETLWQLRPGDGLWVPRLTPHLVSADPTAVFCCTYFAGQGFDPGWPGTRPVAVNTALREMLLHLADTPMPMMQRLRAQRVITDLLSGAPARPSSVPLPQDPRISELAAAIIDDPSDDSSIEDLAWRHAVSVRTISRAFAQELGMSFSQWRTVVRMSAASALLTDGHPVSAVAHRVGYATTSAFSAAFRRAVGVTPSEFLSRGGELPHAS